MGRQRSRCITLETIAPLSDEPTAQLPGYRQSDLPGPFG